MHRGQGDEVAMVACLCALGKLPISSQWAPRQANSRNAPQDPQLSRGSSDEAGVAREEISLRRI